jgi:ferredoxin
MGERSYDVEIVVPEDADSEHAGETAEIEARESEYVLAAARNAGLWLPADCQQGWCTTCAAELLEGEVDQSNAKRYYEVDEEEGMILTCVAKPRSDLRIRSHQEREMLERRAEHDEPPGKSKLG